MTLEHHSAIELLVACSTPRLTDAARTRIVELAGRVTDWSAVTALAGFHRAAPMLYDRLHASGATGVPQAVLAGLRNTHLANAVRTARLAHRLANVMGALEDAGVPALSFKGPILAQEAYDDPSLRQFDDLDVIVGKRDLRYAKKVIEALGYKEILGLPEALEASLFRPSKPYILRHRDGSHDIDLSCRIFHDYFSFHLPRDVVWGRSRAVTIDCRPVRTISNEALFLYLCVHGAKHLWSRPAWISDIAGLLFRQTEETDWEEVLKLARASDGSRMLHLGVELAAWAHGAPVPGPLVTDVKSDPEVVALSDEVRERLRTNAGRPERDDLDRLRFHLRLRQRLRSRLRYLFVRGLTPSYNDWRALSLPGSLFPLYYPLRLLRLFTRASRGLAARLTRQTPP